MSSFIAQPTNCFEIFEEEIFSVTYYGSVFVSKHASHAVLAWILRRFYSASEIKLDNQPEPIQLEMHISSSEVLGILPSNSIGLFIHRFSDFFKFSKREKADETNKFFGYIVFDTANQIFLCHVFESKSSHDMKSILRILKQRVKSFETSYAHLDSELTASSLNGAQRNTLLISEHLESTPSRYLGRVYLESNDIGPHFVDNKMSSLIKAYERKLRHCFSSNLDVSNASNARKQSDASLNSQSSVSILASKIKSKKRAQIAHADTQDDSNEFTRVDSPISIDSKVSEPYMKDSDINETNIDDAATSDTLSIDSSKNVSTTPPLPPPPKVPITSQLPARDVSISLASLTLRVIDTKDNSPILQRLIKNIIHCIQGEKYEECFGIVTREPQKRLACHFFNSSPVDIANLLNIFKLAFRNLSNELTRESLCELCPIRRYINFCDELEQYRFTSDEIRIKIDNFLPYLESNEYNEYLAKSALYGPETSKHYECLVVSTLREIFERRQESHFKKSHDSNVSVDSKFNYQNSLPSNNNSNNNEALNTQPSKPNPYKLSDNNSANLAKCAVSYNHNKESVILLPNEGNYNTNTTKDIFSDSNVFNADNVSIVHQPIPKNQSPFNAKSSENESFLKSCEEPHSNKKYRVSVEKNSPLARKKLNSESEIRKTDLVVPIREYSGRNDENDIAEVTNAKGISKTSNIATTDRDNKRNSSIKENPAEKDSFKYQMLYAKNKFNNNPALLRLSKSFLAKKYLHKFRKNSTEILDNDGNSDEETTATDDSHVDLESDNVLINNFVAIPNGSHYSPKILYLWRRVIKKQMETNSAFITNLVPTFDARLKLSYVDPFTDDNLGLIIKWKNFMIQSSITFQDLQTFVSRNLIPKYIRGKVWNLSLKLRNVDFDPSEYILEFEALSNTQSMYDHSIFSDRLRTYPFYPYFSEKYSLGLEQLTGILTAYSNLNFDVGYCQGLAFVVGLLIIHSEDTNDCYKLFRYLMSDLQLSSIYECNMEDLQLKLYLFFRLIQTYLPELAEHFDLLNIYPVMFASTWFLTIFASQFSMAFSSHVLDLVFLYGKEILFSMGLAILTQFQNDLISIEESENLLRFLKDTLPLLVDAMILTLVKKCVQMNIKSELRNFSLECSFLNIHGFQTIDQLSMNSIDTLQLLNEVKKTNSFLLTHIVSFNHIEKPLLKNTAVLSSL